MTGISLRWRLAQWLELRWWKRYLRNKAPEDYLQWKTAYWKDFLDKLNLPPLQDKKILDAGCGPAGVFLALNNCRVTAIDPLLGSYSSSLSHFQPGNHPHVTFRGQSIEELDEVGAYDLVFCLNAINHVSDISKSFYNLISAVKPGGIIIVSIDAHRHKWLIPLFRMIPGDALHPHQYNAEGYLNFLKEECDIFQNIVLESGYIFDYRVIVAGRK